MPTFLAGATPYLAAIGPWGWAALGVVAAVAVVGTIAYLGSESADQAEQRRSRDRLLDPAATEERNRRSLDFTQRPRADFGPQTQTVAGRTVAAQAGGPIVGQNGVGGVTPVGYDPGLADPARRVDYTGLDAAAPNDLLNQGTRGNGTAAGTLLTPEDRRRLAAEQRELVGPRDASNKDRPAVEFSDKDRPADDLDRGRGDKDTPVVQDRPSARGGMVLGQSNKVQVSYKPGNPPSLVVESKRPIRHAVANLDGQEISLLDLKKGDKGQTHFSVDLTPDVAGQIMKSNNFSISTKEKASDKADTVTINLDAFKTAHKSGPRAGAIPTV